MTGNVLETVNFPRYRRLRRLARAFADRDFRHAFMGRQLRAFLAQQIRMLRGEQSQKEFGDLIGKPQSVVSRLEKQADKNISLQTLIDIASRLDIAVVIRFVDFPTFLRYTEDQSDSATAPSSYNDEQMNNFLSGIAHEYIQPVSSQLTMPIDEILYTMNWDKLALALSTLAQKPFALDADDLTANQEPAAMMPPPLRETLPKIPAQASQTRGSIVKSLAGA